jgi:hypothetical protein
MFRTDFNLKFSSYVSLNRSGKIPESINADSDYGWWCRVLNAGDVAGKKTAELAGAGLLFLI